MSPNLKNPGPAKIKNDGTRTRVIKKCWNFKKIILGAKCCPKILTPKKNAVYPRTIFIHSLSFMLNLLIYLQENNNNRNDVRNLECQFIHLYICRVLLVLRHQWQEAEIRPTKIISVFFTSKEVRLIELGRAPGLGCPRSRFFKVNPQNFG